MATRRLKVALTTHDRERVDGSFEEAQKVVVYEVDAHDVRTLGAVLLKRPGKKELHCGKSGGETVPTRCGGRKVIDEAPDEREIRQRVSKIEGVSVLVVRKALHAYSALALQQAGVFPVRVEQPEFIGAVLARLQELLRLGTPLWMERRAARQPVEESLRDRSRGWTEQDFGR